ncbi:F-box protein [Nymphaea thermarum]|nr:F-box protein [Nymphaea thermarum]
MVLLQDCEELVLHNILSKVGARHAAQLSCLSKSLRNAALDDSIWAVKSCWDAIKSWASENFPELLSTLQRGASESEINEMEQRMEVKFPLATRIIYRFVNGQEIKDFDFFENEQLASLGLIGGYSFYGHSVNVHLLPLSEIFRKTTELAFLFPSNRQKCVVMAASCNLNKFFFLDCSNSQLYVGTGNLDSGEMMPCVPNELVQAVPNQQDALLLWLEEYGRHLHKGMYRVRKEQNIKRISLYPETSPLCTTAVTNGVQVRASAVFVPENSDLQSEGGKYFFSYSIRMRLISEGNILDGTCLTSCQLCSRHWIFRANGTIVSDISDKAVIGKYPLLYVDGEEFVYESCTNQPSSSGSAEGAFTFVPGSLRSPKGRPFDAEIAQFPVNLPEYIF